MSFCNICSDELDDCPTCGGRNRTGAQHLHRPMTAAEAEALETCLRKRVLVIETDRELTFRLCVACVKELLAALREGK